MDASWRISKDFQEGSTTWSLQSSFKIGTYLHPHGAPRMLHQKRKIDVRGWQSGNASNGPKQIIVQKKKLLQGFLKSRQGSGSIKGQVCVRYELRPEGFILKAEDARTGSIDEIYDALVERLLPVADTSDQTTSKYIVGLAGPPGAGKSTLANEVVRRLNMICPQKAPSFDGLVEASNFATVVPMDGFHLYRSQLDAMEDPDEAHARRGAPWTFDPVRLLECLTTLKEKGSVYVPSFDHGVGDPVEDDIFVGMKQKLVIVEGNYLLLADGVWKDISRVFDEKWFIDIDIEKSMKRVVNRHIATGKAPDVAKWRVEYNDRPNAELIMKSKKNADLVICSVDFNQ